VAFWSKKKTNNFSLIIFKGQESFSRDKFVLAVYIFTLLSILGQASLILVSWSKLPGQIPLFYSLPWGERMLVSPMGLWILPGSVIVLSGINYFVISYVRHNSFLTKTIIVFTLITAFLATYDTAKIISLLI